MFCNSVFLDKIRYFNSDFCYFAHLKSHLKYVLAFDYFDAIGLLDDNNILRCVLISRSVWWLWVVVGQYEVFLKLFFFGSNFFFSIKVIVSLSYLEQDESIAAVYAFDISSVEPAGRDRGYALCVKRSLVQQ